MYYIDSNVFIYASLDDSQKGEWCRDLLSKVIESCLIGTTSFLTWDEYYYTLLKKTNAEIAYEYSEYLSELKNLHFLIVDDAIISTARKYARLYHVKPRDAIHASSASIHQADGIITEDSDFNKIPHMKTIWLHDLDSLIDRSVY